MSLSAPVRDEMVEQDRAFTNRLKSDPRNVAAQLVALTQISDWCRIAHRANFDNYLIAAAELISEVLTASQVEAGEVEELVHELEQAVECDTQKQWADVDAETIQKATELRLAARENLLAKVAALARKEQP